MWAMYAQWQLAFLAKVLLADCLASEFLVRARSQDTTTQYNIEYNILAST